MDGYHVVNAEFDSFVEDGTGRFGYSVHHILLSNDLVNISVRYISLRVQMRAFASLPWYDLAEVLAARFVQNQATIHQAHGGVSLRLQLHLAAKYGGVSHRRAERQLPMCHGKPLIKLRTCVTVCRSAAGA
jgi:hypothetical protein